MSRPKTLLKANIDSGLLGYLTYVNNYLQKRSDREKEHDLITKEQEYEGWGFLINQILRAGLPDDLYDEYRNPYLPEYELYELPIKREEERIKWYKYEADLEDEMLREMYPEDFIDEENKEDT